MKQEKPQGSLTRRRMKAAIPESVLAMLAAARRRKGLSLRQVEAALAERGEVFPFASLSRFENGLLDPGLTRIQSLLELYDIDPLELGWALAESDHTDSDERLSIAQQRERGAALLAKGQQHEALALLGGLRRARPADAKEAAARYLGLLSLAKALEALGRSRAALDVYRELLVAREIDRDVQLRALIETARIWIEEGSAPMASALAEELARRESELRDVDLLAEIHHLRARAAHLLRSPAEASALLDKAYAHYRKHAAPAARAEACLLGAEIGLASGQPKIAEHWLGLAAEIDAAEIGATARSSFELLGARLAMARKDPEAALGYLGRALSLAIGGGDTRMRAIAHAHIFRAHEALRQPELARLERDSARALMAILDDASRGEVARLIGEESEDAQWARSRRGRSSSTKGSA